jgi:hypothetical protein
MNKNKKRRKIAYAISQSAIFLTAFLLAGSSGAAAPTGNSGTVKVDGIAFADHHANEPHPSCDFRITFWGYGEGREATVTFTLQAPTKQTTGPGSISYGPINIGADPAGGGNDFDGQIVSNLAAFLADSGATAHPIQGYHVKLTVNATGSRGADVKHKVFWVTCVAPEVTPTPTPSPSVSATVLGKTLVKGKTLVRGKQLAKTGVSAGWMSLIALQLLLIGMVILTSSRRPKPATRLSRL